MKIIIIYKKKTYTIVNSSSIKQMQLKMNNLVKSYIVYKTFAKKKETLLKFIFFVISPT